MKSVLFAALMAAGTAMADDMITRGEPGYYARLQDAPCTHAAILAHVKDDFRPDVPRCDCRHAYGEHYSVLGGVRGRGAGDV